MSSIKDFAVSKADRVFDLSGEFIERVDNLPIGEQEKNNLKVLFMEMHKIYHEALRWTSHEQKNI